jgi:hypothetical protein
MSDTPRTDIRHCEACGQVKFPSNHWQAELATAIAQRDKARNNALEEAAWVCEKEKLAEVFSSEDKEYNLALSDCAAAIRAMKKECGK